MFITFHRRSKNLDKTIVFIGDMNGNSQALARRFVDLGFKCEIIPFYEDYVNSSHFKYTRHQSNIFVHDDATIYNGYPVLSFSFFWGIIVRFFLNLIFKIKNRPLQTSKAKLQQLVKRNELIIVGTGISPLLLKYLGRPLDIYYPSSQGVEFIGSPEGQENARQNILRLFLHKLIKRKMINALKNVKLVLNSDVGLTHETLSKMNLQNYLLDLIPFVDPFNYQVNRLSKPKHSFKLVMFSRLHWVRPDGYDEENWKYESKNNDLFLLAFANFISDSQIKNVELTIVEYGKDIAATRALVRNIGLTECVKFHPIVPKQDILTFLNNHDILIGEFYKHNVSIGGSGLEALQLRKPFLNGGWIVSDKKQRLRSKPPIYFCNTETDIRQTLTNLIINGHDPLSGERNSFYEDLKSNIIIKSWLTFFQDGVT